MGYLIVGIVSVVATFMGFATEVTRGNIRHLQNGREPNAGAALLPNIPCVPLLALGFAWTANQFRDRRGFYILARLVMAWSVVWAWDLRRARRELNGLLNSAKGSVPPSETVETSPCGEDPHRSDRE